MVMKSLVGKNSWEDAFRCGFWLVFFKKVNDINDMIQVVGMLGFSLVEDYNPTI